MAPKALLLPSIATAAALTLAADGASSQTYGFAALPPGTLNHTTASAVAKVMREQAGLNVLVQPAGGGKVIVSVVGRGEAAIGTANIMGYSAMRSLNDVSRVMLATAGLTEVDVIPVKVPDVMRSADDFVARAGSCPGAISPRSSPARCSPASSDR